MTKIGELEIYVGTKEEYEDAIRADERAEWEGKPIAPVNVDELIKEVRRMG